MKTLYIECNMGAAGDMIFASLLELIDDKDAFLKRINNIGIPKVKVKAENAMKCGISGTHIRVFIGDKEEITEDVHSHFHEHNHEHNHDHDHEHEHEHEHNHNRNHKHDHEHNHDHEHEHEHDHEHNNDHSHNDLEHISEIIESLNVSKQVKQNALDIYMLIAKAESHAHNVPVNQIHFHEVGNLDAIADIVGVCMLIEELKIDKILASPIATGYGNVRAAHGILPVPAPATAFLLKGIPAYSGRIESELCTPTGAAILKHFVSYFGEMPMMSTEKIGIGCGKKDFDQANILRAFLADSTKAQNAEEVIELSCNIDDMTAEELSFAVEVLRDEGAIDVYTSSTLMKKGRSGFLLSCLCERADETKFANLIFRHTSTIGLRVYTCRRHILRREITKKNSPYGDIRIKTSYGEGFKKSKIEFEDLKKHAKENNMSLRELKENLEF